MKNALQILCFGLAIVWISCNEPTSGEPAQADTPSAQEKPAPPLDNTNVELDPALQNLPLEIASGPQYKINLVDADPNIPRKEMIGTSNGMEVKINYGSPQINERLIWDYLVPYDEVWECGGNGVTKITFPQSCTVAGVPIPAGTYVLFVIPRRSRPWTIIFNQDLTLTDASGYDPNKDLTRFQGMPYRHEDIQQILEFVVVNDQVMMAWEAIRLPIAVLEP